jgi:hypothetical protein
MVHPDRMEITSYQTRDCAPFDLIAAKDFDWPDERRPSGATGRFLRFFWRRYQNCLPEALRSRN